MVVVVVGSGGHQVIALGQFSTTRFHVSSPSGEDLVGEGTSRDALRMTSW